MALEPEEYINTCLLTYELSKTTRKISRLLHHIPRCKQDKDRVYLVALVAVNTAYSVAVIQKIKTESDRLISLIID